MRRIITGHNQDGKSVIKIDGPPSRSIGEDVGVLLFFGCISFHASTRSGMCSGKDAVTNL